jgi:hypothetical protein
MVPHAGGQEVIYSSYPILSLWKSDELTPPEIGARFLAMLQQLDPLSPAMSNWMLGDRPNFKGVALADVAPAMTAFVEHNIWRGDFDEPEPIDGYCLIATGSAVPQEFGASDSINITVTAGSTWNNQAEFEVGGLSHPKDFELITYPLYRGALEILVSNWPCPWALAYEYDPDIVPIDGPALAPRTHVFSSVAWIAYLSAPLATGLAPPPPIVSEPTPGGGLILSAAQERLDPRNPEHMRRSRLLQAIMLERVGMTDAPVPYKVAQYPARVGPY